MSEQWDKHKEYVKQRNEEIVKEMVLGKTTYREMAKKHGISQELVRQILAKYRLKSPMDKRFEKYWKWKQRLSQNSGRRKSKVANNK